MTKPTHAAGNPPRLTELDMSLTLNSTSYKKQLKALQDMLMKIQQAYLLSGRSAVIVFEGWDAAGKGGTIRRVSAPMDPRSFKVWPIGAPRKYYLERHYLSRFVERLPPDGAITAFDRSWYGRVLVERVEKLTPTARWKAAYREINEFERMLTATTAWAHPSRTYLHAHHSGRAAGTVPAAAAGAGEALEAELRRFPQPQELAGL